MVLISVVNYDEVYGSKCCDRAKEAMTDYTPRYSNFC